MVAARILSKGRFCSQSDWIGERSNWKEGIVGKVSGLNDVVGGRGD